MTILNLNVIIYLKLLTLEEVKTMKYFLIEGIVTHPERMTNEMMQEHQKYTNLLMKAGKVLFSSLKSDMSSSITVIKSRNEIEIQEFYKHEPLFNCKYIIILLKLLIGFKVIVKILKFK